MTTTEELDFCSKLITALEYLIGQLEAHEIVYKPLWADVNCLLNGRLISFKQGEDVKKVMVNGLKQQVEELKETEDKLRLEVMFSETAQGESSQGTD